MTPFKVPDNISLVIVDYDSGKPINKIDKKSIYESFKSKNSSQAGFENSLNINTLGVYRSNINKEIFTLY